MILKILWKNCQVKNFCSSLTDKKIVIKSMSMFLKFNAFKIKKMKYYHDWYLKCNDLLLLYAPYDKSWGWTYFRHIYLLLEKSMKGGVSYIFKTCMLFFFKHFLYKFFYHYYTILQINSKIKHKGQKFIYKNLQDIRDETF